ncbi:MAG TPA: caspase family protein [Solirubrobacteraceae bacterium]|nr:caspase family protein [Solirubrobacteraceae bacterium]
MPSVYALVVAVDGYEPPISRLGGCRNDADRALEFLRARLSGRLCAELLLDADATRDNVLDVFRTHLGRAGPDDVALFWFSGHGGQQKVAEELWHLEPTGLNQTLVCSDSRRGGVPDLADKELSLLLDGVAAKAGHTAAILDCCHSGGGTRDPLVRVRGVGEIADAAPVEALLPALQERARDAGEEREPPPHVALSACRSFETAKEQPIGRDVHGVFTHALLAALETLGPGATYRQALAAARARVESLAGEQAPVLYPVEVGGIADQPFLGGRVARPAAGFVLRHASQGWEVDAGRCHGIPPAAGADAAVLEALEDGEVAGQLRVAAVEPARSRVEPLGWAPDEQRQYPVVVASLPLPPAGVVLGGLDEGEQDDAEALQRVGAAISDGHPDLRVTGTGDGPSLRVAAVTRDGAPVLRILRGDGSPATADVAGHGDASAAAVVARLEHIVRWTRIKDLDNPASGIAGAVTVEVVEVQPGEQTAPRDRPALAPGEQGDIRLAYRRAGITWEPPSIFIRLRNHAGRPLFCVLLDLTDRYRVHPKLFPGAFVAPGGVGAAREGRPVPVTLPPDREAAPGAVVKDWFKVIAADEEFSSSAYDLPLLGEPAPRGEATARGVSRRPSGAPAGGDWTTSIVGLVTEVPRP